MLLGDLLDRRKFVDAGVVNEDIDAAEILFGLSEKAIDIGGLGEVGLDGDGFATLFADGVDDSGCAGFAGGVVDDDGGAVGGELFGDFSADSFGCAGDD